LLGLLNEAHAIIFDRGPHLSRLVSHDHEDTVGRSDRERRLNRMLDQGFAARLMQHLGPVRFHARAQACGKDHHCYSIVCAHDF
jgi:hypothetical protein